MQIALIYSNFRIEIPTTYRHCIDLKIAPSEAELNSELISNLKTIPIIYEIYNASYLALVKFE